MVPPGPTRAQATGLIRDTPAQSESEHRQLGDFGDFQRARRRLRVPVVLSRGQCQQLFEALEGTARLMAELMYGSGLRLLELLRLRVKDVDLERRQIAVREGKGGKDRLTLDNNQARC